MRDDFLSGDWAVNRHRLHASVDKLARRIARAVGDTFAVLTRQQFDAPWQHRWRRVRIGKAICSPPPSSPRRRAQLATPRRFATELDCAMVLVGTPLSRSDEGME